MTCLPCLVGGSQGLEAAYILQALHRYVDVRLLVRRYRQCEHADTLEGMPPSFRDVVQQAALKMFHPPPAASEGGGEGGDVRVVLYSRDYREMHAWVPRDSDFVIGQCRVSVSAAITSHHVIMSSCRHTI